MSAAKSEKEKLEKLCKIVQSSHTAFMVTRSRQGFLHGRPMATAKVEADCHTLWFAADRNSPKIDELREDSHVCLGYSNASGSEWASVNGNASIVDDRTKIHELYSAPWNNWFDGPDDPKIILIKVDPQNGEYWDAGNKVVAMVKYAVGAITGHNQFEDDNEKVNIAGTR
jgi:general stress protein 26